MEKYLERRKRKRSLSISVLNDMLSQDPTNSKVWNQLGEVYLNHLHYENALDCYETALSLNSEADDHVFNSVRQIISEGDHENAHNLLAAIKDLCWRDYRKSYDNILFEEAS